MTTNTKVETQKSADEESYQDYIVKQMTSIDHRLKRLAETPNEERGDSVDERLVSTQNIKENLQALQLNISDILNQHPEDRELVEQLADVRSNVTRRISTVEALLEGLNEANSIAEKAERKVTTQKAINSYMKNISLLIDTVKNL